FTHRAGRNARGTAVADFDGNGWFDLAVANAASNDVTILLNDGDWPSDVAPHGGSSPGEAPRPVVGAPIDGFVGESIDGEQRTPILSETVSGTGRHTAPSAGTRAEPERPVPSVATPVAVRPDASPRRLLDRVFSGSGGRTPWERVEPFGLWS